MVRIRSVAHLALAAALLAGCAGDDDVVQWRDATIEVPEGWHVFEEEDTRLSMANVPQGEDADPDAQQDLDVVAMHFTHSPGENPGDLRAFVEDQEGTIESDVALDLDGVPATRIIYSRDSVGVDTREMSVVVPAREVSVLALPVPSPGDEEAQELFMEHLDTFNAVIESIEWSAPVGLRD